MIPPREVLEQLAGDFEPGKHDSLRGPYFVEIPGECTWTVATDGKAILFVRGMLTPVPCPEGALARLLPLFRPPHDNPYLASVDDLKALAGEYVHSQRCPECDGTSTASRYVNCSFCDDKGIVEGDVRGGWLIGLSIDRNRLAGVLRVFEPGTVAVYAGHCPHTSKPGDDDCFWVVGKQARGALMAMSDPACLPDDVQEQDGWKAAPSFPGHPVDVLKR
jgi:hypothetical protein